MSRCRSGPTLWHAFWANVREFDAARSYELERKVDVLCLLNTHPWILVVPPERCVTCQAIVIVLGA